ncbi:hypothetical protein NE237_015386 [Protea cynaroides]|uniref:Peptide transporter n=1 Tax=Protea cynaroides TaxID=273540 RepID=A0A9Q0QR06_9MAGN|nr:hypothetical protein NE237_015386 [Protea cynaroides]
MAYYGIPSILTVYIKNMLYQGTVSSSSDVSNYWTGALWITSALGAYVADARLGCYWTFLIASAIYLLGMCLLTLSVSLPALRPPQCHQVDNVSLCKQAPSLQLGVFYVAVLVTLAIGIGGTKLNILIFGADQVDYFDRREEAQKFSFFNWWMFSMSLGTLFANTFLVYIQGNVSWVLGYVIPTVGLAISIVIFLAGTPFYRHRRPAGSPYLRMLKVIVAAIRKWRVPIPNDPNQLFEHDLEEYTSNGNFRIYSTSTLRYLNKASVRTDSSSPWMLCSVTQVEETKQTLCMIPVMIATFVPSTMLSQINTLFVKQGTTLDTSIGSFHIPPASLITFVSMSVLVCIVIYDQFFKMMRRLTRNSRGISILQRMGIGLFLYIIVMVIASLTERKRLSVAKQHGLVDSGGTVPLSIFILLPQVICMGLAETFLEVAKIEFFYCRAPKSMKSVGISYSMIGQGIGSLLSSFLLSTVSDITKRDGHKVWIQDNLNASHLDYYYAFFAGLNLLNFIFFLVGTKLCVYKAVTSEPINGNA